MIPIPDTCIGCPLHSHRKGFSVLEGDGSSGLMVIAESLGRNEERDGLPLRPNAPSGGVFQKAVDVSGLSRSVMTLTNTIRCKAEAPYPPEALAQCRQYLDAAIEERKPRFILALGDVPLKELSPTPVVQSEVRGYVLPTRYGVPMLGTFHPSRIARGDVKLTGLFRHDIRRAESFARKGIPERRPTRYIYDPTDDQIRDYIERLLSDVTIPISYDTETPELIGEKSDGKTILLMQFSSEAGTGMALGPSQMDAARVIMALSNPKWGWADRTFDRALLRANGFQLNGELHDLMNALAHLQPSFMSSKDETSGEKNIPAKLMSLQSCVSLYQPWEQPWKRMVKDFMEADPDAPREQLMAVVKDYAIRDVDMTIRVGQRLFQSLHSTGLIAGYTEHKFKLSFALDFLSEIGLPVDMEKQVELRDFIEAEEVKIGEQIQELVPLELRPIHPKDGYKGFPKDLREAVKGAGLWVKKCRPHQFHEQYNALGYMLQPFELETAEGEAYMEQRLCKMLPFNMNSSDQLLAYIRHMGYRVPLHVDTKQPTTGKDAIDRLILETDDTVLKMSRQSRKLTKLKGVYAGGDWTPRPNGRVHAEFRFGSASGQISATRPNVQQFVQHYNPAVAWEVDLVKRTKAMVRAEAGHKIVKTDMRGFHSRAIAHLAGDPLYYRMALHDIHSAVTAHFLELPEANRIMGMTDNELDDYLGYVKKEHKYTRDFKVKRAVHGMQFLLQAPKLYEMNSDVFESIAEAAYLMDTIRDLWPITFKQFPAKVEKMLRKQPWIDSPFKHRRYFWDLDEQQATAYLPSNCSHATIQSAMIRLFEQGAFATYSAINFLHDAVWWMPRNSQVDECIIEAKKELERPSEIMISDTLGAFWCPADAEVGDDLNSCKAYSVV